MPDPREPIESWIDEALVADVMWMRSARAIVFVSPSRDQVRSMIEAVVPLIAAHADASKRSTLAQVPFEGVCPAEVTTFTSLKLECESDPADHHGILHYDVDQGIWWIHDDEMFELARKAGGVRYRELPSVVNPVAAAVAAERERIASRMDELAANYPEDVFPPDSDVRDGISGTAMRHAYTNAAREIRETGNA